MLVRHGLLGLGRRRLRQVLLAVVWLVIVKVLWKGLGRVDGRVVQWRVAVAGVVLHPAGAPAAGVWVTEDWPVVVGHAPTGVGVVPSSVDGGAVVGKSHGGGARLSACAVGGAWGACSCVCSSQSWDGCHESSSRVPRGLAMYSTEGASRVQPPAWGRGRRSSGTLSSQGRLNPGLKEAATALTSRGARRGGSVSTFSACRRGRGVAQATTSARWSLVQRT